MQRSVVSSAAPRARPLRLNDRNQIGRPKVVTGPERPPPRAHARARAGETIVVPFLSPSARPPASRLPRPSLDIYQVFAIPPRPSIVVA